MYSLDLHNAVKMSYKKKCIFSFSECEFCLMRSFSCHTDRTNRGITVVMIFIIFFVVIVTTKFYETKIPSLLGNSIEYHDKVFTNTNI